MACPRLYHFAVSLAVQRAIRTANLTECGMYLADEQPIRAHFTLKKGMVGKEGVEPSWVSPTDFKNFDILLSGIR
jgi:hypothetical protein